MSRIYRVYYRHLQENRLALSQKPKVNPTSQPFNLGFRAVLLSLLLESIQDQCRSDVSAL